MALFTIKPTGTQLFDNSATLTILAAGLNAAAFAMTDIAARLALVRDLVPGRLCLTTSFGIEDQLLTCVAAELSGGVELGDGVEIVTLDTGRLFPEIHDVWRLTERHLGITIAALSPPAASVAALVARDGNDGFTASVANRRACCHVRKLEPLARALSGVAAWITGLRGEQSPDREGVPFAEVDAARGLLKINPLFDWSRASVLAELGARAMPVSALEGRGYRSVGCAPCTRAVRPDEPERAGRWWWEELGAAKECGLHPPAAFTTPTMAASGSPPAPV